MAKLRHPLIYLVVATAVIGALSGCAEHDTDGCDVQRVVSVNAFGFVEVDNGHTYRPGQAANFLTGQKTSVCDVLSKLDGQHHYSIRGPQGLVLAEQDPAPPPPTPNPDNGLFTEDIRAAKARAADEIKHKKEMDERWARLARGHVASAPGPSSPSPRPSVQVVGNKPIATPAREIVVIPSNATTPPPPAASSIKAVPSASKSVKALAFVPKKHISIKPSAARVSFPSAGFVGATCPRDLGRAYGPGATCAVKVGNEVGHPRYYQIIPGGAFYTASERLHPHEVKYAYESLHKKPKHQTLKRPIPKPSPVEIEAP